MLLEKINSPKDVKKLSKDELHNLAEEIRTTLITYMSAHGGHVASNLGVVELTIALHSVFNSPIDKIIFDVSHQSYVHKMLTGRAKAYLSAEHYDDVSGYTDPEESEHDFFNIGHTSTSLSLCSGLAKARDIFGNGENIVAVIGDGSLSGGEAYEGLNYLSELGSNFIVIINDNDMSIAEVHGGINIALKELRESKGLCENNVFKALGLDYRFVQDGHDIDALIETLTSVKDIDHPVVIHVVTEKGHGFALAENDPENWHHRGPFNVTTGEDTYPEPDGENYYNIAINHITKKMDEDKSIIAVNAATPGMFYMSPEWRAARGAQYVDVGIAEEHAMAMISGAAKYGAKPVFFVGSSFMQRTYDQVIQDLCVNNNPAVIINYAATVSAMTDITHLGFFDIAMLSNIPNLVYLAPTNKEEELAMIDWAIEQKKHPVAIRIPWDYLTSTGKPDLTNYYDLNKYEVKQQGSKVAIIGLGNFYSLATKVAQSLDAEGIHATLINPKFITGVDADLLESLQADHQLVVTLEDGLLEGGFGQKIASFYGASNMLVKNYGIRKAFYDRYDPEVLLAENGITVENITKEVKELL